jgi:hypothetical protein
MSQQEPPPALERASLVDVHRTDPFPIAPLPSPPVDHENNLKQYENLGAQVALATQDPPPPTFA